MWEISSKIWVWSLILRLLLSVISEVKQSVRLCVYVCICICICIFTTPPSKMGNRWVTLKKSTEEEIWYTDTERDLKQVPQKEKLEKLHWVKDSFFFFIKETSNVTHCSLELQKWDLKAAISLKILLHFWKREMWKQQYNLFQLLNWLGSLKDLVYAKRLPQKVKHFVWSRAVEISRCWTSCVLQTVVSFCHSF